MGKYVYSYSSFLNESANAETAADKILAAASKHIKVEGYLASDYAAPDKLQSLVDNLYSQIKNESGAGVADSFMEETMQISQLFIAEDSCPTCEEMMEPCDACKDHAAEANEAEEDVE
jgi:hypothetical protein